MDWHNSRSNYRLSGVFVAFIIGIVLGCAFGAVSLVNSRSDPGLFAASDWSEFDGVTVEDQGARCVNQIIECAATKTSDRIQDPQEF